jgi:hypothetical protein
MILTAYSAATASQVSNLLQIQDSVISSLRAMEGIVEQLVLTGGTSAHYRKALNCLQTFRQTCLQDFGSSSSVVVERFNVFLKENVKHKFKGGRHDAFWKNIVTAGVSLLHVGETSAVSSGGGGGVGGVSAEDSRLFLLETVVHVVEEVAVVKQEEEEEEDLFGDMA